MLIIISPAKTLDFERKVSTYTTTVPQFEEEANLLMKELCMLSVIELSELMNLNQKLAHLNVERYQQWEHPDTPIRQALLAFRGEVYRGIEVDTLDEEELEEAQTKLRILSGLYGILKPADVIKPHRLEMGTRLSVKDKTHLYGFWGKKITQALADELAAQKQPCLINLASVEYFKVIDKSKIKAPIITPVFKEVRNGRPKVITVYAKKARGLMTRFIIQHRLSQPNDIKQFKEKGYCFTSQLSTEKEWVFTRRDFAHKE